METACYIAEEYVVLLTLIESMIAETPFNPELASGHWKSSMPLDFPVSKQMGKSHWPPICMCVSED